MGKYRIYEIAKELNQDNKVVLDYLNAHQIAVKSHMSSVDDDVRARILKDLGGKAAKPVAKPVAKPEFKPESKPVVKPEAGWRFTGNWLLMEKKSY